MVYVIQFMFYGIPIAAILFLAVSLYRYMSAKKENKKEPGRFSAEEMKKRKFSLVISSVIAGILVFVVIAFIVLLFTAVAFM